jgi:hypothetical protein
VFFAFSAAVCSLSAALLSAPSQFLVWMTPGAREGLALLLSDVVHIA